MPNTPPNLLARGDINPSRFVKQDTATNFGALEANANELVIGISHDSSRDAPIPSASTLHAANGDQCRIFGDGDVCLLVAGGAITAGIQVKSDADGKGVVIATTGATLQNIGAVALEDAASGESFQVQIQIGSLRPEDLIS